MSDLQTLFVVLIALHLIECLQRIPGKAVVFCPVDGEKWEAHGRGSTATNSSSPWVFTNPLMPFRAVIVCHEPTIVPCAHGILSHNAASASSGEERDFRPFGVIRTIEANDNLVLINGKPFAKTPSQLHASSWAAFLNHILPLPACNRPAVIEAKLSRMLDTQLIRDRISAFQAITTLLRWACNLLFLYLFILSPLAIWWLGTWIWPVEVLGLAVFLGLVIRSFLHAYGVLYPECGYSRWVAAVPLLSPPAASHAAVPLLKDLLYTFHPLAAASVLCSRDGFEQLAAQSMREIQFSPDRGRAHFGKGFAACVDCDGDILNDAIWRFVETFVGPPEKLLRPPVRTSTDCKSYCPRCWTQYVIPEGICPDCEGLPLCALEEDDEGSG